MPKIISEHQREQTKKDIIKVTRQLIQSTKGIKNITVDDIIKAVGVGKSSFYSYYNSKEECIYEVIVNSQIDIITQFKKIMLTSGTQKERIIRFLRDVYIAEDSISNYISSNDMAILLRKLPPEYSIRAEEISDSIIADTMKILNLGMAQTETITVLLDCIDHVITHSEISKQAKEETINTLILSITEYVDKNSERKNEQ